MHKFGIFNTIICFLHLWTFKTPTCRQVISHKGNVTLDIYNIGCDEGMEYSILEVAKILIQRIKGPDADVKEWITFIEDRLFNDKRYYISNQKLKDLGWTIKIDFMKGLNELC